MFPLRQLNADAVAEWLSAAAVSARAHAPGIDRLAGPTSAAHTFGTDVADLLADVAKSIAELRRPLTLSAISDELTAVVRGPIDSGAVAVGLVVAALSELSRNRESIDVDQLSMVFELAAEKAADTIPGASASQLMTVLSNSALAGADASMGLGDMTFALADAGLDDLELAAARSEELSEAGVVDAMSASVLVLVDALVAVVHGEDPELPEWEFPELWENGTDAEHPDDADGEHSFSVSMSVVPNDGIEAHAARQTLEVAWIALGVDVHVDLGGSSGTQPSLTASVRTANVGPVIEAAIAIGRPSDIKVAHRHG